MHSSWTWVSSVALMFALVMTFFYSPFPREGEFSHHLFHFTLL